jgi:hypothetical protein
MMVKAASIYSNVIQVWSSDTKTTTVLEKILSPHHKVKIRRNLKDISEGSSRVLVAPLPSLALADEFQKGTRISQALNIVREQTADVLTHCRQNRSHTKILELSSLAVAAEKTLSVLGVPVTTTAVEHLKGATQYEWNPVLAALAHEQLRKDHSLRRLDGEFAAFLSFPSQTDPFKFLGPAVAATLENYDKLQDLDLLQTQQRTLYQQLEALYRNYHLAEQKIEALEHANRQLSELAETQAQQVTRFENSRSYRVTAPLRGLRRMLVWGR